MICIDGTALDSRGGSTRGIGSYVKQLNSYLAPQLPSKPFILRNDRSVKGDGNLVLPISKVSERVHWLANRFFLPDLLKKNNVSLFHSTHPYTVTKSKSFKTIATVYDLIPLIFYDEYLKDKRINAKASYKYYLDCLKHPVHFIAISDRTKLDLIEHIGISEEKISVIYLAVDSNIFYYNPDRSSFNSLYSKYKIPKKYFLYVGGADFRKNISGLIQAYSKVVNHVEEDLVLIGSWYDDWLNNFNQELEKLKIKSRVHFLSYVSSEDICGIYSLANALLFPSLYEGFGFPVLEAFTCGTPVLCSNNSSLIEIASEAAHTVNPESIDEIAVGIERLSHDIDYRNGLKDKGLIKSREFSVEKMCRETLDVYSRFY